MRIIFKDCYGRVVKRTLLCKRCEACKRGRDWAKAVGAAVSAAAMKLQQAKERGRGCNGSSNRKSKRCISTSKSMSMRKQKMRAWLHCKAQLGWLAPLSMLSQAMPSYEQGSGAGEHAAEINVYEAEGSTEDEGESTDDEDDEYIRVQRRCCLDSAAAVASDGLAQPMGPTILTTILTTMTTMMNRRRRRTRRSLKLRGRARRKKRASHRGCQSGSFPNPVAELLGSRGS